MRCIESREDIEILELQREVKLGGNIYEENYSYWARLIPDELEDDYNKLVGKKLSELNGEELELLNRIAGIMRFAFLQGKVDSRSTSKSEYIEYLKLRKTRPIDELRISKMNEDELIEAEDLILAGDLDSLLQKDSLSVSERYAKEVLEHRSFMRTVKNINDRLSYSSLESRGRDAATVELVKKSIFR